MNRLGSLNGQNDLYAGQVGVTKGSFVNHNPNQSFARTVVRKSAEVAITAGIAVTGL